MQDRDTKQLWESYIAEMDSPPQAVGSSSYASQQGVETPSVPAAQLMPDGEDEKRVQSREAKKEKKSRRGKALRQDMFKRILRSWGIGGTGRRT